MSYLNILLNGVQVEWKTLGEVGDVRMCKRILKEQTSDEGEIPFYKIGTFGKEPNAYISKKMFDEFRSKYNYPKVGHVLISASGTIGRAVIFNGEDAYFQDSNIVWIENDESQLLNKYLFYFYQIVKWEIADGGTIQRLYNDNLKKTIIPIPPLSVQTEIVRILDTFTEFTAELTAELTARKTQYNYYREQLLSFDEGDVEWKTLGDLSSLITKGTTPKNYTEEGIAFIKTEAFDGTYINTNKLSFIDEDTHNKELKRSILNHNDILITIAGATIGKCAIVPKEILPANTNQALAIIRLKDKVNLKYVFHLIKSNYLTKYIEQNVKGSAQPNLNLEQLNNFPIPYPPLEEQARIVSILDKFDTLTTSITEGLPKEIELRKKQYEYYRDMLLTFSTTKDTKSTKK